MSVRMKKDIKKKKRILYFNILIHYIRIWNYIAILLDLREEEDDLFFFFIKFVLVFLFCGVLSLFHLRWSSWQCLFSLFLIYMSDMSVCEARWWWWRDEEDVEYFFPINKNIVVFMFSCFQFQWYKAPPWVSKVRLQMAASSIKGLVICIMEKNPSTLSL